MMARSLSLEEIRYKAPSVFATEPYIKMSEKYRFVPTIEPVTALMDKGFLPVYAGQSKTRIPGKGDFTRHVLRFRHTDFVGTADSIPEIVLLNSHDGSSAYKLMLGFFRIVCSNGMIVCSGQVDEISARHSGREGLVQEVIEGSFKIVENAPVVTQQIEDWRGKALSKPQQLAYASAALELRDAVIKPNVEDLITPRRNADKDMTVWHTFNTVQENLIRGGLGTMHTMANGRRAWRHTRAVKSVNEDVKLNRALWRLTEELNKSV